MFFRNLRRCGVGNCPFCSHNGTARTQFRAISAKPCIMHITALRQMRHSAPCVILNQPINRALRRLSRQLFASHTSLLDLGRAFARPLFFSTLKWPSRLRGNHRAAGICPACDRCLWSAAARLRCQRALWLRFPHCFAARIASPLRSGLFQSHGMAYEAGRFPPSDAPGGQIP